MIKLFIERLEEATVHTWKSILKYIDEKLDDHNRRIIEIEKYKLLNDLEKRVLELEKSYDKTRMEVENGTENRKFWKKTILTAVIGIIIGWIATMIGIV